MKGRVTWCDCVTHGCVLIVLDNNDAQWHKGDAQRFSSKHAGFGLLTEKKSEFYPLGVPTVQPGLLLPHWLTIKWFLALQCNSTTPLFTVFG